MIRGLLGAGAGSGEAAGFGFGPVRVDARRFTAPLLDPLTRDAWTGAKEPQDARTTLATLDFGGASGLYDSRHRLCVEGEHILPVEPFAMPVVPLKLPPAKLLQALSGQPAVQLFVNRARAVRPDFQLNERNAQALLEITYRLQGIPLAIELAAAWTQTLTLSDIQERLTGGYSWLTSRRRDLPERHRTLDAVVLQSERYLPEPLRRLMARLSICAGGWDIQLAAALEYGPDSSEEGSLERVCQALMELREKSLISAREVDCGDESRMRFGLLEPVREYFVGKLSESERDEAFRAMADYFLSLARNTEGALFTDAQAAILNRLQEDYPNIVLTLRYLVQAGDTSRAIELLVCLERFWLIREIGDEPIKHLEKFVSEDPSPNVSVDLRIRALITLALLYINSRQFTECTQICERAIALMQETKLTQRLAMAKNTLARSFNFLREFERAEVILNECLIEATRIGDRLEMLHTYHVLAVSVNGQERRNEALEYNLRALELIDHAGDTHLRAKILNNLGVAAMQSGRFSEAGEWLTSSIRVRKSLGDARLIGSSLFNLGRLHRLTGELSQALTCQREAVAKFEVLGHSESQNMCIAEFGLIALSVGEAELAATLLAYAASVTLPDYSSIEKGMLTGAIKELRDTLTEDAYSECWARGRSLTRREALDLSLSVRTTRKNLVNI